MSRADQDRAEKLLEKTLKKRCLRPPDRWKNWYRSEKDAFITNRTYAAGEEFCSRDIYPTREIAEENGLEVIRQVDSREGSGKLTYLGPRPEDGG